MTKPSDNETEDTVYLPALDIVKPTGRPEVWSQDIADEICARITAGQSLKTICSDEHMPGLTTVVKWRRERPIFAVAYARAREDQADTFADEMMEIADDRSQDWKQDDEGVWKPDHDHVTRAKLRIETRKFIAAKLKPQTYGERVDARISGQVNHAHAHMHATLAEPIDAGNMTVDERDALRALLLPKLKRQEPTDDEA